MPKKTARVREPVQVYLDRRDRDLLEELARATGLSRAELIRRGLRKLAGEALVARRPGSSLDVLAGSLPEGPSDLSTRLDDYVYGDEA